MINKHHINIYLKKLKGSREFTDSQKYVALLEYLIKASLRNERIKEITLATNFFHKNPTDSVKDDSTARVYVHHLRKKLDSYYMNEGGEDACQFIIPKGSYEVQFRKKKQPIHSNTHQKEPAVFSKIYAGLITIICVIFIILFIIQTSQYSNLNKNQILNHPIWTDIKQSRLTTKIVFGDYFQFSEITNKGQFRYIRDARINSSADLNLALSKGEYDKKRINEISLTALGKYAPWGLFEIFPHLYVENKKVELKLASQLQWEDIENNNILYIGSFKTLGLLKTVISNLHFKFQISPTAILYDPADTTEMIHYDVIRNSETGFEKDYALVAKLPGPKQNTLYLFISNHDIGQIQALRHFTNPESLKYLQSLSDKHAHTEFFEMFFEVKGYLNTGLNIELLHYFPVSPDYSY